MKPTLTQIESGLKLNQAFYLLDIAIKKLDHACDIVNARGFAIQDWTRIRELAGEVKQEWVSLQKWESI